MAEGIRIFTPPIELTIEVAADFAETSRRASRRAMSHLPTETLTLQEITMDTTRLVEEYLAGPGLLRTAVSGMTPEQLAAQPISGKWSTHQVVCHIADFEPVYVDRMKRVIAQEEPTFFGGDPDLFAARLVYDARDIQEELNLIESCRRHMGRILRTLAANDFQRRGIHSEAGPMTLEKLLTNVTNHIPHHIRFIQEKRAALGC